MSDIDNQKNELAAMLRKHLFIYSQAELTIAMNNLRQVIKSAFPSIREFMTRKKK